MVKYHMPLKLRSQSSKFSLNAILSMEWNRVENKRSVRIHSSIPTRSSIPAGIEESTVGIDSSCPILPPPIRKARANLKLHIKTNYFE